MKTLKFIFCFVSVLALSACSNTWEGFKADARAGNSPAGDVAPVQAMEKHVLPKVTGYSGQDGAVVLTPPQGKKSRSFERSGLIWNNLNNYDAVNPVLPEAQVEPVPAPAEPVSQKVIKYSESISVYPVDGDAEPFTQVSPEETRAVDKPETRGGDIVQQIFFGYGSSSIGKADKESLRDLGVSVVKATNPQKLSVIGHASKRVDNEQDPVKRKMINFKMAQKRADAVMHELWVAGVKPDWLMVMSKGDDEFNLHPGDKTSEAADRRVEVYMDGK